MVRDALIDTMEGVENARWQADEQLHVTLRFIGEVDTPLANDIADALAGVSFAPFDMRIAGVGHFERKETATSIWAAIAHSEQLKQLQSRVERACRRAGCTAETRKFIPHVTLARLNRSTGPVAGWLARNGRLECPPWRVDSFILYESHLGTRGSQYEQVSRYAARY